MYELEVVTLIGVSAMFTFMAKQAMNEILRILYTFIALFSMIALVGTAAGMATAYGLPVQVLDAVFWGLFVVVIFEFVLDVIGLLKPALLAPLRARLGGKDR